MEAEPNKQLKNQIFGVDVKKTQRTKQMFDTKAALKQNHFH